MIFFIWRDSVENLQIIFKNLNHFHLNLKFTSEKSRENLNFLNINLKLKEVTTAINLYSKPKDGHQNLHYESCQTEYIKKFNQTFRLKRICSGKKNFYKHVIELEKWYDKREEKINCIPLAAIYNPLFENLNSITKKNLNHLYADQEVKKNIFTCSFCIVQTHT